MCIRNRTCTSGSWGACEGNIEPEADDLTCNNIDEDCNGVVDDGYVATPTSCGVGVCADSVTNTCDAGVESDTCTPGTPGTEVCDIDVFDEDCDGTGNDGC